MKVYRNCVLLVWGLIVGCTGMVEDEPIVDGNGDSGGIPGIIGRAIERSRHWSLVRGHVFDVNGDPVRDASVAAFQSSQPSVTNTNEFGEFSLEVPIATQFIHVHSARRWGSIIFVNRSFVDAHRIEVWLSHDSHVAAIADRLGVDVDESKGIVRVAHLDEGGGFGGERIAISAPSQTPFTLDEGNWGSLGSVLGWGIQRLCSHSLM